MITIIIFLIIGIAVGFFVIKDYIYDIGLPEIIMVLYMTLVGCSVGIIVASSIKPKTETVLEKVYKIEKLQNDTYYLDDNCYIVNNDSILVICCDFSSILYSDENTIKIERYKTIVSRNFWNKFSLGKNKCENDYSYIIYLPKNIKETNKKGKDIRSSRMRIFESLRKI
jgi:hypothetical protein